jgi:hypothetical protein
MCCTACAVTNTFAMCAIQQLQHKALQYPFYPTSVCALNYLCNSIANMRLCGRIIDVCYMYELNEWYRHNDNYATCVWIVSDIDHAYSAPTN